MQRKEQGFSWLAAQRRVSSPNVQGLGPTAAPTEAECAVRVCLQELPRLQISPLLLSEGNGFYHWDFLPLNFFFFSFWKIASPGTHIQHPWLYVIIFRLCKLTYFETLLFSSVKWNRIVILTPPWTVCKIGWPPGCKIMNIRNGSYYSPCFEGEAMTWGDSARCPSLYLLSGIQSVHVCCGPAVGLALLWSWGYSSVQRGKTPALQRERERWQSTLQTHQWGNLGYESDRARGSNSGLPYPLKRRTSGMATILKELLICNRSNIWTEIIYN